MAIVTFPFNQGQVYSGGNVVDLQRSAYAYIDDTVTDISFDPSVYQINFFAFDGDTQVIYTTWITESPYSVPALAAHTRLGINIKRLDNAILPPEQAQAAVIFRNNLPAPVNLDIIVINPAINNGISLVITGGNTVSIAAKAASNNSAGVLLGASNGAKIVNGVVQMDMATAPTASLVTVGVVQTRNGMDPQVTSDSVSIVPTQYYVQTEIARLEVAISGATGSLGCEPISSYVEP